MVEICVATDFHQTHIRVHVAVRCFMQRSMVRVGRDGQGIAAASLWLMSRDVEHSAEGVLLPHTVHSSLFTVEGVTCLEEFAEIFCGVFSVFALADSIERVALYLVRVSVRYRGSRSVLGQRTRGRACAIVI